MTPAERDQILQRAIDQAPEIRSHAGWLAEGAAQLAPLIAILPKALRASDVWHLPALDVRRYREALEARCEELGPIHGKKIRFIWLREAPVRNGALVLGRCKAVSERDRATWEGEPPPPWWEIRLALPNWLLSRPIERLHVLHHELMHCDCDVDKDGRERPTIRPHDIEDNTASLGRFGPLTTDQGKALAAAFRHPGWSPAEMSEDNPYKPIQWEDLP